MWGRGCQEYKCRSFFFFFFPPEVHQEQILIQRTKLFDGQAARFPLMKMQMMMVLMMKMMIIKRGKDLNKRMTQSIIKIFHKKKHV